MVRQGKLMGGVQFDPVPYYYNQLKIGCNVAESTFLAAVMGLPLPYGAPPEICLLSAGIMQSILAKTLTRIMAGCDVPAILWDAVLKAAISEN